MINAKENIITIPVIKNLFFIFLDVNSTVELLKLL